MGLAKFNNTLKIKITLLCFAISKLQNSGCPDSWTVIA